MPDQLRVGLLGCGSQGRYLTEALHCTGLGTVVAGADPSEAARDKAREQFGLRVYEDVAELLATEQLDAAIVATIHDQLQPVAMQAVNAGLHAFVEKPLALTAAEAQVLVDAAAAKQVKLMVGYALRCKPERVLMKKLLSEGVIGSPVSASAGQMIGNMGGWLGQKEHGGGPLMYVGSHALDNLLWMVDDEVTRVYAEVIDKPDSDVEAEVALTLRFKSGCLGYVATSQRMGGRYGWLDLMGTGGRLRAEWESLKLTVESRVVEAYRHLTEIEVPFTGYYPKLEPAASASLNSYYYIRMWAAEMVEFVSAIREDRAPSIPGEDAVRALQVMEAALESGRSGQAASL